MKTHGRVAGSGAGRRALPRRWPRQANRAIRPSSSARRWPTAWPTRRATQKQKPGELIRAMGLQPGMTVADIGTGIGYMLPFLSRRVGADGQVIAEDIFDDFLAPPNSGSRTRNSTT